MTDRIVDGRAFAGQQFNPYKMRVYANTAQNIPDNAITKVNYDTVDFDTSTDGGVTTGFNSTNHNYLVPITGYYVITACVGFVLAAILGQLQYWYALIYKNAAQNELGQFGFYQQPAGVATARIVQGAVTDTIFLLTGDTIDIRLLANMGAAVPIQTGTSYCYWSIHLISV